MSVDRSLNCFKAYDVRGKLGREINEEIAYCIGRATAESLETNSVALGFDARETSYKLAQAVSKGICDAGADVVDIGFVGTEEIYSAVSQFKTSAGIEITASHNPIEYNGMKIIKANSQPLSKQEFFDIRKIAEKRDFLTIQGSGSVINKSVEARKIYIEKILSFINLNNLKPLKIVLNSGNGAAGPVIDAIEKKLLCKGIKTNFVLVHHNPDSSFPNGIPNPLIEENRFSTKAAITSAKADFGVAFDGDFDRCFLFDQFGNFIPGEYVVSLLAEIFLKRVNDETIVHDPRVIWNIIDIVTKNGGNTAVSKTGHTFIKDKMCQTKAVYGGEMSAHHYFRDFFNCDSGMIPWLLIWELLSNKNIPLAELIAKRKLGFPSSGEINFTVSSVESCFSRIKMFYAKEALLVDELDGISMQFENWRFNLRSSNTEPLVRLNIETKCDQLLLSKKVKELTRFLENA